MLTSPSTLSSLDAELDRDLSELARPAEQLQALDAELRRRGLLFGANPIPTFLRPHLLPGASFDRWTQPIEALFRMIESLIERALGDDELAGVLGFSGEALRLVRLDPGYRPSVVVARPDAVLRDGLPSLLEINSDSPAMMTFADELEDVLVEMAPLARQVSRLERRPRVPALLEALLACYRTYGGHGSPYVAIVDWPGEKTAHELLRTAERFTALGTESVVASPTELVRRDGHLEHAGRRVDLVYRRVLFRDFLTRREELEPLLSAYTDGSVCMANPLRSYMVGTKTLLALLHDTGNPLGLTLEERALVASIVPETFLYDGRRVRRSEWVLKKSESYGGKDVIIGDLVDDATWEAALEAARRERWVLQHREEVPRLRVPVLDGDRFRMQSKYINWNPFVFSSRHGGSITRVSDSLLINITRGGGLLPTIRTHEAV